MTIPNSVTSIGRSAFEGCVGLTSVNIPNAVTSIGDKAFYGCPLDSVNITNSVTYIGNGAFVGCHKAILHCNYVGDDYFHYVVEEREGGYPVDDGEGQYTPERYYWSIDINNSLRELEIGKEVISVGSNAFSGCDALEKVVFHCKEIGSNWFKSWDSFYKFDDSESYAQSEYIPKRNSSLKEIVIGDEVTTIGGDAFVGCNNLTSVTIGDNVTSIGERAFNDCPLSSVTIPNSVTSVGRGAFSRCKRVVFHCKEIRNGWFDSYCYFYDYASTFPGWYDYFINSGFWESYSSLQEIVIGDEVTTIGDDAFVNKDLTSVTIGDNVTSIGESAFNGCPLSSVTIPNSVTSIGEKAFNI